MIDFEALLEAMRDANVEFLVVGGTAAVLHGAPLTTEDVDIVHRRTPENVERLLGALRGLDGFVRDPAGRHLMPSADTLLGRGQVQLVTRAGPLDLLCELHDGRGYEELFARTDVFDADGLAVRVLDLDTLIEVKRSAGRAKDRIALPVLLALRRKQSP